MTSLRARIDKALDGAPEDLPNKIKAILAPDPANKNVLICVVQILTKLELSQDLILKCVFILVEMSLSSDPISLDEKFVLVLNNAIYLLTKFDLEPKSTIKLCRSLANVIPMPANDKDLAVLLRITSKTVFRSGIDMTSSYSQECVLWYLWLHLQMEQYRDAKGVNVIDTKLPHWRNFSGTLLRKWSAALAPIHGPLACRLVCSIIQLSTLSRKEVFSVLDCMKMNSPLLPAIESLAKREIVAGLEKAVENGVADEYAYILNSICINLISTLQQADYLELAKTAVDIVKCCCLARSESFENSLLLLRHVIYNRNCATDRPDRLSHLVELICELKPCLPLDDAEHPMWKTESLAKVASNISNLFRDAKDHPNKHVLEEIFIKITCVLLPKSPTSKDCQALLRLAALCIESGLAIEISNEGIMLSPPCIAAIIRLYGVDNVDPLFLVACIGSLKAQGAYLCDQFEASDSDYPKWVALETYALLRLNADRSWIEYVEKKLRLYANDNRISEALDVLSLRVQAQTWVNFKEPLPASDAEPALLQSAKHAIRFAMSHKALSVQIADEIAKSKELMKQEYKTNYEKVDQMDRKELSIDMPLALTSFRYSNYADLVKNWKWVLANYQQLRGIDYWLLLSTFVFDDLKTAIGFFALNGDSSNELRALAIQGILLRSCRAPETVVLENKLRIAEALLRAGCLENARHAIDKLQEAVEKLTMYSEDFFCLQYKIECLKIWLKIEENGSEAPKNLDDFSKPMKAITLDKIVTYVMNRYYVGKAIIKWNLQESGKQVPSDLFESAYRNIAWCILNMDAKATKLSTWERFEVSLWAQMVTALRTDHTFELGMVKDTVALTLENSQESQHMFSFYYLLRHIERVVKISLYFEHQIDSKMALISDITDPKRGAHVAEKVKTVTVDGDEFFDLRNSDTIPYHSAMIMKMKELQVAAAANRIPAREFIKFTRRRKHDMECKCVICYSVGIHMTLKRIDSLTAHITKEKFACFRGCVENRLNKAIKSVMNVMQCDVAAEMNLNRIESRVEVRHQFSLACGLASDGNFVKATEVLQSIDRSDLSDSDNLELEIRMFEYGYNIDWSAALDRLNLSDNVPLEKENQDNNICFKTPAVCRKPVIKNVAGRRGVRLPFDDPAQQSSSTTIDEVPPVKKTRKAAQPKSEKPTTRRARIVVLEDEPPKRMTRRKALDMPRFDNKPTESLDDLFDDDDALSNTFSRLNLKERLKKPSDVSAKVAEEKFQKLLDVGRKCVPFGKQALLCDLFRYLAFLSASRGNREQFVFYLEKSIGIGIQLAAINRGNKMAENYSQVFLADYFKFLQPTVDFVTNWSDAYWDWCDPDWTIVQMTTLLQSALTPGILVTRYQQGSEPQIVKLNSDYDAVFRQSFFKEYDNIQTMNKVSLKVQERNKFWSLRAVANERLENFCSTMENIWMGCWKGLFLGKLEDPDIQKHFDSAYDKIIDWASSNGFKVDSQLLSIGVNGLHALTEDQFSNVLCKVLKPRPEVVSKQIQVIASRIYVEFKTKVSAAPRRKPVVLVLDKHLIRFPFESCPAFENSNITRMPCMSLVVSQALLQKKRSKKPFVLESPDQGFYCVNPGTDLKDSELRFQQFMEVLREKWSGVCGKPLEKGQLKKFLQSKSVYLYCGHGTGRQHMREHLEVINVKSVAFIIGCSSGKLLTFGTKMDPEGYALRLILGGAPAVLANLWDVTDKDIDLFTYSVLRKWLYMFFPDEVPEPQLGLATNLSRKVCKLKALVGSAPVIYGLPCTSFSP